MLWAYSYISLSECYFYTLIDILFGHYMLTCGGDWQCVEILDLFTFKFTGKGLTCMPVILTT